MGIGFSNNSNGDSLRTVQRLLAPLAVRPLAAAVSVAGLGMVAPAHADAPLAYLRTHGLRADPGTTLMWGMLVISIAVVLLITALLLLAVFHRRAAAERPYDAGEARGTGWMSLGIVASAVVLFAVTIWTVVTLAAVSRPPLREAALDIEVTGHQWWWEVRYGGDDLATTFRTANEIHIPIRQPVRVTLRGIDVIHSFWIPALTGKTDIIPGQQNVTWFEADAPGVYRGQCTEYCGQQHAHMALEVIASPPKQFEDWRANQLTDIVPAKTDTALDNENTFVMKCGVCHTVRGTRAGGVLGPDLSHLMTRRTLAAGTLPNTPGYLSGWIADPQHIKPGSLMPQLDLSGPQLAKIRDFLETLK